MGFSFSNKLFGGTGGGVQLPVSLENGGTGVDLSGAAKGDIISGTGAGTVGLTNVGADGLVLTCDAASAGGVKWAAGPAPAAAGADTQVLFNDGGALAGDAGLTYSKTTNGLNVFGPVLAQPLADAQSVVMRRFTAAQTNKILQVQTELNAEIASIAADGSADFTALTLDTPLAPAEGGTGADTSAIVLGGLLTGSGAGTIAVKAVGADGTFLKANSGAAGGVEWAAGGGGITNSAGANVIPLSDGTNLVASALTQAVAGTVATTAGTALGLTATAPAATTGASQAGIGVTITASPAVASTDTAGAAAGGSVTITAGAAARLTSGDTNGGDILLATGAGIGTYTAGIIRGSGASGTGSGIRLSPHDLASLAWLYRSGFDYWKGSLTEYGVNLNSAGYYGFAASTTQTSTADLLLRRRAAANPAWGAASAAPVSYVHTLAADGTGTNIGGANATLLPGIGTGTGAASRLLLGGPILGSTGSVAQTTATPVSIGGEVKADGTQSFLNVTGTLGATHTADTTGANVAVTGAGSSAFHQLAASIQLLAGYTGAKGTYGLRVSNASLGTGTSVMLNGAANVGINASTIGASTGDNFGFIGTGGYGFGRNIGIEGTSIVPSGGGYGIGVYGVSLSAGGGITTRVGGYFRYQAQTTYTEVPTALVTSAALVADNSDQAVPIFRAIDNTVNKFVILDGGNAAHASDTQAVWSSTTDATGTADVGLVRDAAGVLRVSNASTGVGVLFSARNVEAVTTTKSPAATESNEVYTNEGDADGATVTLPTAAVGLTYTFYVQTGQTLTVTANTGDTIRIAGNVTAAAGSVTSNVVGSSVTLVAINATEWVAVSVVGTWSI